MVSECRTMTTPLIEEGTPPTIPVQFTARLDPRLHAGLRDVSDQREESLNAALGHAVQWFLEHEANRQTREQLEVRDGDGNPPLVELAFTHDNGEGVQSGHIVVEGKTVPYLEVHAIPASSRPDVFSGETTYTLTLDGRYGTAYMTYEELWKQAWFWSNAMAVAAGYSSHGPNARHINRHGDPERLATNIADGWTIMAESGQCGKAYEVTMTLTLPHMVDGDQWAYDARDHMRRLVHELGARDVVTRIISLGGLEPDRRDSSPMSDWTGKPDHTSDVPVPSILDVPGITAE